MLVEIDGVLFDAVPVERFHGDHGNLGSGLLLDFKGQRFQLGPRARVNYACQVGHISGRLNALDVLGMCDGRGAKQQAEKGKQSVE